VADHCYTLPPGLVPGEGPAANTSCHRGDRASPAVT
jgi:hypothetical protein